MLKNTSSSRKEFDKTDILKDNISKDAAQLKNEANAQLEMVT